MNSSLGRRMLAWSAAGTILTLSAILLLVDSRFRTTVSDDIADQLAATTRLTSELHDSRFHDLLARGASLAMNPVLRGSVETRDPATIRATLTELREWAAVDWLALLTPAGELLAWAGAPPPDVGARAQAILSQVAYYDTGDLWRTQEGLVEVVASTIYFAETPLGVVLAGVAINQQTVDALEQATLQKVGYLSGGRLIAASAGVTPETRQALERLPGIGLTDPVAGSAEGTPAAQRAPLRLELAGEPFLVGREQLRDARGNVVAEVINLRSLREAMAPVRRLRASMLGLAALGLLLAALSSWLLTRSVTRPVHRLLDDAQRMGAGDLDAPVSVAGQDEIGALARGFETMRASLRDARAELIRNERLSAIGRAAGAIVHDFAQPITVLMGHVQLIGIETDPAARAESIDIMRGELDRLRGMMGEILEFTRGEKQLVRLPVTVGPLVDNIVRGLAPGLAERNIHLVAIHGFDGEWALDAQRMTRVLHNLIGNAASAIGRNGEITIRTTRIDDRLRIAVSDNGPGIPADIRDSLFEPFVTAGKKGGTGLGLAIVKNIIERQGGTIQVASSADGSTFVMEIPSDTADQATATEGAGSMHNMRATAAAIALLFALGAVPTAHAQTVFSGQVDLIAKSEADQLGINRTLRGNVYNEYRVRGFARTWLTDRIGFFGEVMYDGRFGTPYVVGAYFVMNDLAGKDWLNARVGLAPPLVGSYSQRSNYFNANPVIGAPLVWSYMTVLDGTGMETVERLRQRLDTQQRGVPALYDACWNMQWELLGEVGRFEYSVGVTPAAVSNPKASGYDGVQLLARIGAEPSPGLRIGASGALGPYIGSTPTSTATVVDNPEDYDQRLGGIDLEWSRGPVRLFAEAYATEWQMPLIDSDLGLWSGYLEGRYTVSPGWYLAGRFDQLSFFDAESDGESFRWDDDLWRAELAVGYRIAREVLLKLDWQHTHYTTGVHRIQNLLAVQLSAVF